MVAATRKKPEILGRKITGFGIGFVGVRHGLAEAGEAAFLSCSMMGYRHRERPLPRPRNRTKPCTEKRVSAEKRRP